MNTLAFKIGWRLALYPALLCAALSFAMFWTYAHPRRFTGEHAPSDFGLKAEALKLKTSDGVTLDAWFIPNAASRKAVIVCHGYPMDKSDVLGNTAFLARRFNLLYFDFRGTGRSGGFFSTGGAKEVLDLDAAAAFLRERGFREIGVFGFSMGGGTALLSRNPAIKARALEAPFADLSGELDYIFSFIGPLRRPLLGMMKLWARLLAGADINAVSPVKNTAAFTAPLLLIHGDRDGTVPLSNSLAIKAADPAAELWIVKGADHGQCHYKAPAEYEKRLSGFFKAHL